MAKKASAGDLYERVGFEQLQTASDGAGGTLNGFAEQFVRRAEYIHLRSGEAVLANRLEGRHSQIVRVRADSQTRTVTADWQVRDKRTDAVFQVKDVTIAPDRQWVDVLVMSGVGA
jgi:head-tail adaptor